MRLYTAPVRFYTEGRCEGGEQGREMKISGKIAETMLYKMSSKRKDELEKWSHRIENRKPGYEKNGTKNVYKKFYSSEGRR